MNENIFSFIQNDNTAYWLGFLAADGSIHFNQIQLGLSIKDLSHVEKFKSFIQTEAIISTKYNHCSNNDKYYPTAYLSFKNKQIVKDLSNYGIIQDKTHTNIDFLSYIPDLYKIPFILGMFDGDGYFTNTDKNKSFGICGNQNTMQSICTYLNNYFNWTPEILVYNYLKSPSTYYFQTTRSKYLFDFIQLYLSYENKCDLLDRKVETAKDILSKLIIKEQKQKEKRLNKLNKNKTCPICNKSFFGRSSQIYCSQICAHKAQERIKRPSRKELKDLIRNKSFLKIGEKYNVSDNAIRKWCKAMNLPFQKKVINSFTDEEWEKI